MSTMLQNAMKQLAYALLLALFVFGCDSSGGNGGPPDSAVGTWEGEATISVDTSLTGPAGGTWDFEGTITRSVTLVLSGESGDLAADIRMKDSGTLSGYVVDKNREVQRSAEYGAPTLIVRDPPLSQFDWRLEATGPDRVEGKIDLEYPFRTCTGPCAGNAVAEMVRPKALPITLTRQ